MMTGRIQLLLVLSLLIFCGSSAWSQSEWEREGASGDWPPLSQACSHTLSDPDDSSAGEALGSDLNIGGIGNEDLNAAASVVHSGNPAATDLQVGTGWLGDHLGVNQNGFRFGGINISDVNAQLSGGVAPGQWTTDSLTIFDASLDTEECMGWDGGRFGAEFLFYSGGNVTGNSGSVMGYNSLDGEAPRTRFEIYTLWYRQYLLDKKFSLRFGKLVPVYDFNNVVRSVPLSDDAYDIPAVSSAILTPLYASPTQLGVMPGYYNSATGMVALYCPNDKFYVQYGLYDGNLAAGRQTGLAGPRFNGYYVHVVESGADWTLGQQKKPGAFGAGYWKQTGLLSAPGGDVRGAEGVYLFGSQRLYFESPGQNHNGLSAWIQLAATNSDFISTHRYFGTGLTYFGPLQGRDNDSAGFALAYGKMNTNPAADLGPQEVIYTGYYQYQVSENCFLQPNLTYISTPASSPGLADVFAITFRALLLF